MYTRLFSSYLLFKTKKSKTDTKKTEDEKPMMCRRQTIQKQPQEDERQRETDRGGGIMPGGKV
jgi:hypothetical protein